MVATPPRPMTSSEKSRNRHHKTDRDPLRVRKKKRSETKSRRRHHSSSSSESCYSSSSSSSEDYSSSDSERRTSHRSKRHKHTDKSKKNKDKEKGKRHRHRHHKNKKHKVEETSGPVQLSKFLGKDKDDGVRRSAVSGKKILLKLDKTKEDKMAETNRNELLKFLNASYD